MQASIAGRRLSEIDRNGIIELVALAALAFIYFLDVVTPADLSVEVAYEVPVAIGGLTGSRNTFIRLALLAAFLNFFGFLSDGMLSTFDDPVGLQNRIISLASLTLVCTLMIVVQRAASKNANLESERKQLLLEREMTLELERANRALATRQEMMEELVEAIAHDVRTPLAALSLTLKQALRGEYGTLPDDYRDVATESRTSIDDIARLADTLLATARFEAGAPLPPRTAIDVALLARDLANEFAPIAAKREVALDVTIRARAIVDASHAELRRALGNLVANALRHTPPGGHVTLEASPTPLGWRIDVCDDGVGVSASSLNTLFARYSHTAGGSGLGLYIVKRIAESFDGSVSYEPRSPAGSRFSMDLPRWRI